MSKLISKLINETDEIIPYKKYNGIKQAVVKKQNTFKEALTNEIKKRGFDTSRIEIITIG